MPVDINVEFEKLQSQYLQTRSNADLYKLYELIRNYMTGFMKRYTKVHGIYLSDIEGKIEDATYFIIEQYMKKHDWKIDRFTAYYHNAIVKTLHNEEVKQWDKLKRTVERQELTDNNLSAFTTDVDKDLKTIKDIEQVKGDQSEAVQCLRHRWKQGELFE